VRNLKLTLQYDGTDFSGFAAQPKKRTVRQELEKALLKLFKKPVKFFAASRTDAGVHALGQVISFKIKHPIPPANLKAALNALLPEDSKVVGVEVVREGFNARFSAKSKEYEYLIFNGGDLPVLLRKLVWQVKLPLKLSAMRRAAKALIGRHDFTSFCAAGAKEGSKVRIIYKIDIRKTKRYGTGMLGVQIKGNGFLYRMVRNIVGTLLEVGIGRIKPDKMKEILRAKDRRKAGRCAPPQGLCLLRVNY
jgi:tRNA pseudouridine38-40 synthase